MCQQIRTIRSCGIHWKQGKDPCEAAKRRNQACLDAGEEVHRTTYDYMIQCEECGTPRRRYPVRESTDLYGPDRSHLGNDPDWDRIGGYLRRRDSQRHTRNRGRQREMSHDRNQDTDGEDSDVEEIPRPDLDAVREEARRSRPSHERQRRPQRRPETPRSTPSDSSREEHDDRNNDSNQGHASSSPPGQRDRSSSPHRSFGPCLGYVYHGPDDPPPCGLPHAFWTDMFRRGPRW